MPNDDGMILEIQHRSYSGHNWIEGKNRFEKIVVIYLEPDKKIVDGTSTLAVDTNRCPGCIFLKWEKGKVYRMWQKPVSVFFCHILLRLTLCFQDLGTRRT